MYEGGGLARGQALLAYSQTTRPQPCHNPHITPRQRRGRLGKKPSLRDWETSGSHIAVTSKHNAVNCRDCRDCHGNTHPMRGAIRFGGRGNSEACQGGQWGDNGKPPPETIASRNKPTLHQGAKPQHSGATETPKPTHARAATERKAATLGSYNAAQAETCPHCIKGTEPPHSGIAKPRE